jgi:hypothetical protein
MKKISRSQSLVRQGGGGAMKRGIPLTLMHSMHEDGMHADHSLCRSFHSVSFIL